MKNARCSGLQVLAGNASLIIPSVSYPAKLKLTEQPIVYLLFCAAFHTRESLNAACL